MKWASLIIILAGLMCSTAHSKPKKKTSKSCRILDVDVLKKSKSPTKARLRLKHCKGKKGDPSVIYVLVNEARFIAPLVAAMQPNLRLDVRYTETTQTQKVKEKNYSYNYTSTISVLSGFKVTQVFHRQK